MGPGSRFVGMGAAVDVEPSVIEMRAIPDVAARVEQPLRSWRFTPAEVGAEIPGAPPSGLAAGRAVALPHGWSRSEPELADHKGPCWYARSVVLEPDRHHQLRLDGVDYVGSVYADGRLLGHHEGGFTPIAFNFPSGEGRTVDVAVRVDDPVEEALLGPRPLTDAKRKVKGVFEFHDSRPGGHSHGLWFSPVWATRWGTGGMVGPASVVTTGDVRIEATFVTARRGRLAISWLLANLGPGPVVVELRAMIGSQPEGLGVRLEATVPTGASRVSITSRLHDAEPWVPTTGQGHVAFTHALVTEARVGGVVSDADRTTFGVRTVEMPLEPDDQFRIRVDGRRVYVRAVNHIPGVWIPELDARTLRADLELAAAANVNSVGLHAHVMSGAFYDAADEAGMLVYQDFPLNLANDPEGAPLFEGGPTMGEAGLLLAAEAAYHLYNHPSVVYWCGHNEPAYQLAELFTGGAHPNLVELAEGLAGAPDEEPTDAARVDLWRFMDPTRPAFKASGLGRHHPVGDSHTYSGSLNVDATTAVAGTEATFMSEFGAWTPNFSAEAVAPGARGDWPPDEAAIGDWEQRTHMWLGTTMKTGRPDRHPNFSSWVFASQLWAGVFLKLGIESFRRRMWDPFGGHRYHLFVDHWGDAGAGVVDKHRLVQAHYWALAASHRPVLPVVAVPPSMRVDAGSEVVLATWVCNDVDRPLEGARLSWSLRRLDEHEAFVIGVDDPQVESRFGDPVIPRGDLVVLPSGLGREVCSGAGEVSVPADDVAAGPVVRWVAPSDSEPTAYAVLLRLESAGAEPVESWGAFVVAPPAWEAAPGITPIPLFAMELRGPAGPFRIVRRWTGETVCQGRVAGPTEAGDLPPGQYVVESGGRSVGIDLFGDVIVDLSTGSATAKSMLPWPFDPITRVLVRSS